MPEESPAVARGASLAARKLVKLTPCPGVVILTPAPGDDELYEHVDTSWKVCLREEGCVSRDEHFRLESISHMFSYKLRHDTTILFDSDGAVDAKTRLSWFHG